MLPIHFVPGMMCDERLFVPQCRFLSGRGLVTVADVSQDDTIEGMAKRALLEAPSQPFLLAGLSLGGIVAMEMLRLAPQRIARLLLMATNHRPALPSFISKRQSQLARARNGEFREIVIDELKATYFSSKHAGNQELRDLIVDMALAGGMDVFERQSKALIKRRDQTATLRQTHCPTLLIAGADDPLCPVATHREMALLIPMAELIVLPETGHLITLEDPERVNQLIAKFAA